MVCKLVGHCGTLKPMDSSMNPNRIQPLLLIIFILFNCRALVSQENEGIPYMRNYAPEEYNGHAQNWSIVQDSEGMIYYGNTNGKILQYDGENWRDIKVANNSIVRSMDINKEGTIYVGAVGEFGFLQPNAHGKLEYQSLMHRLDSSKRDVGNVWRTFALDKKVYYTTNKGLYRITDSNVTR